MAREKKKKISQELGINDQTPREIVAELDKYIVGQNEAKKSVAIALRNRWRSHKLEADMRDDVIPKNILMIGSTGVGKTEIARRLARLVKAPFIKVEATKFTEVGYVGRDVESIIRDLAQTAVRMVRKQRTEEVKEKAAANAIERLLDVLVPEPKRTRNLTRHPSKRKTLKSLVANLFAKDFWRAKWKSKLLNLKSPTTLNRW